MKSLSQIREDLKDIRYYYSKQKMFDGLAKSVVQNEVVEKATKYNEAMRKAPVSAKTDNRPEFQKMIKDSVKRLFDVIIVWKLDRFARNRFDSAYYKNVLKKNGVRVVSAKESISEGAEGIILESVLEGITNDYKFAILWESENLELEEEKNPVDEEVLEAPLGKVVESTDVDITSR